jgi:hypothetical protein
MEVIFDASKLEPGIYVGSIRVSSAKETTYIPIILEVDSEDVFFKGTLDIPPQYNKIAAGDKLLAQFKVFDLTSGGTSNLDWTCKVGTHRAAIQFTRLDHRFSLDIPLTREWLKRLWTN